MWLTIKFFMYVGGLQLRNLIVLTSSIKEKWYKLGVALKIRVSKMENLYEKCHTNPMKGLNRVYCYWLSDKNGLSPTWEKLCSALRTIQEFTIAADVEQFLKVSLNTRVLYTTSYVYRIKKNRDLCDRKYGLVLNSSDQSTGNGGGAHDYLYEILHLVSNVQLVKHFLL